MSPSPYLFTTPKLIPYKNRHRRDLSHFGSISSVFDIVELFQPLFLKQEHFSFLPQTYWTLLLYIRILRVGETRTSSLQSCLISYSQNTLWLSSSYSLDTTSYSHSVWHKFRNLQWRPPLLRGILEIQETYMKVEGLLM